MRARVRVCACAPVCGRARRPIMAQTLHTIHSAHQETVVLATKQGCNEGCVVYTNYTQTIHRPYTQGGGKKAMNKNSTTRKAMTPAAGTPEGKPTSSSRERSPVPPKQTIGRELIDWLGTLTLSPAATWTGNRSKSGPGKSGSWSAHSDNLATLL